MDLFREEGPKCIHDLISSTCKRNVTLALKCMANSIFKATTDTCTPILNRKKQHVEDISDF